MLRSPSPLPPPQGDFSETLNLPVLLVLRYLSPLPPPLREISQRRHASLSYSCSVTPPLSPLPSGRFLRDAMPPCPTRAPLHLPSPLSPQGDFSETPCLPVLLVLRYTSPLPPPLREISQRRYASLSYSCSVPPPPSPLPSGRFLRDAKPPCPTRAPFPLPPPPSPQGDFSETLSLPVLLVLRSPSPLPPPLREISQRR